MKKKIVFFDRFFTVGAFTLRAKFWITQIRESHRIIINLIVYTVWDNSSKLINHFKAKI